MAGSMRRAAATPGAAAAGLPLAALVGRRELMSLTAPRAARVEPDAAAPYVFHGGTYNGTPVALAAGLATLNLLEEPGVLDQRLVVAAPHPHLG